MSEPDHTDSQPDPAPDPNPRRLRPPKSVTLAGGGLALLALFGIVIFVGKSEPARSGLANQDNIESAATPLAEPTTESGLAILNLPTYTDFAAPGGIHRKAEIHTVFPDRPRMEVIKYKVQEGDTLFEISDQFSLEPESILWGNWIELDQDPHMLSPGQELNIAPVDGVLYRWSAGDNLNTVADFFRVEPEDIIDWPGNHLEPDIDRANTPLEEGALLIIPGGQRDPPSWQMVAITRANPAAASILGPGYCGSVSDGPVGAGIFEWPTGSTGVSGYYFIPGIHEAIDIGGAIGNAIYAADDGVVVYSGWNNYGYGNVIVIDHGNGWQTLYAHLNSLGVGCSQAVYRGNKIGTMGVTGRSSGPHLHFEMRSDIWGRVNPANYLP